MKSQLGDITVFGNMCRNLNKWCLFYILQEYESYMNHINQQFISMNTLYGIITTREHSYIYANEIFSTFFDKFTIIVADNFCFVCFRDIL